jgi:hypothetical protein
MTGRQPAKAGNGGNTAYSYKNFFLHQPEILPVFYKKLFNASSPLVHCGGGEQVRIR